MLLQLAAFLGNFPSRFRRKVSQGEYRAEIDGLRFYAIALVIVGHAMQRAARFFPSYQDAVAALRLDGYLEIASTGVFLFFAISGFILASQAIGAKADPLSAAFLKRYFGRRVLRIEPPYMILLLATWLLLSLTRYTPEGTHRFFVAPQSINLSFLSSLFYAHDLVWGTFPRLFPPGWSLEVEVQFYILAPLLFALWAAMGSAGARAALAILVLATDVNLSLLVPDPVGAPRLYYSLLHNINFFWIGIVMAQARAGLSARLARFPAGLVTALGWGGLAGLILAGAPGEMPDVGAEAARLTATYASLAAIFASAFDARSGFRRFSASGWISLIGGACYSIYLLHIQIVQTIFVFAFKLAPHLPLAGVALVFAISAAAAVAAGLVYYVQIERRFMARDWPLTALSAVRRVLPRRAAKTDRAAFP